MILGLACAAAGTAREVWRHCAWNLLMFTNRNSVEVAKSAEISMMDAYEVRKQDELPILAIEVQRQYSSFRNGTARVENEKKKGNSKRIAPEVGKHEHLLKSGPLGKCNDPLCTTCPAYFDFAYTEKADHNAGHFALSGWTRRLRLKLLNLWNSLPRGVLNPHTKFVQRWNKFFVISCLVAVFLDPLFFFLLRVDEENKCIVVDRAFSTVMIILRSITDFIYFLHILLQFRLAYVAASSQEKETPYLDQSAKQLYRDLGETRKKSSATWDIVDSPKKIAWNYVNGWFIIDLLAVLPLPQIMIALVVPNYMGRSAGANYAKNLLRVTLLLQYVPRIIRVLPLLSGHTSSGFIFETAWANFVINLLIYLLAGHVVGSCWYLFGLQRVNQCLHNACRNATSSVCNAAFLDCDDGRDIAQRRNGLQWEKWKSDTNAANCFDEKPYVFTYGIYGAAVHVTTKNGSVTRYIYSLFWGFQQISTLAGNQMPSLFIWEVLFLMTVIGLGLLLLTLLIGNMQNFLQSLGRRDMEMQLRRYEVEKWMTRRRLPIAARRRIRQYERFNWAATRGVNEDELLHDLPEDLHRTIRRVLFMDLVKKVRLLEVMDEQLLDAIFQRLHQKLYIDGCEILRRGAPVDRMLFIVHGRLQSEGQDGSFSNLLSGDICGEELLTWYLEHATAPRNYAKLGNRYRTGRRAISSRTIHCVGSVEAFALEAEDLKEVTKDFSHLLRNPRIQTAIRYESHFLRTWAAITIQVFWRYKKRKLGNSSSIPRSSAQGVHNRHRRVTKT